MIEEFLTLSETEFQARLSEAVDLAAGLSLDGDVPEQVLDFLDRFRPYPDAVADIQARRAK